MSAKFTCARFENIVKFAQNKKTSLKMKKFTKLFSAFAILVISLFSTTVEASHFKGADTYFQCLGNGYYKLSVAYYYACEPNSSQPYAIGTISSFSGVTSTCGVIPTSLTLTSVTQQQDVPFYCPGVLTTCDYGYPYSNAPAGTPVGTLVLVYSTDSFYIPPGCTVTAPIDQSARNAAINNLVGAGSLHTSASITVPPDSSCNFSPLFAQYPVNIFCLNQNANFSQGAIDLNGDSLGYTLINPRDAGNTEISFTSGCDSTHPLGYPGQSGAFCTLWSFDALTGNVNFTPNTIGNYVLSVLVTSYHNGVATGYTQRDIQFSVISCNQSPPPVFTSLFSSANVTGGIALDSNHIGVCPGQQMSFTLVSTNNTATDVVFDSSNVWQALPGSITTYSHPNGHLDTCIMITHWTPGPTDSGYHYFSITTQDTACPLPGRTTYAFYVSVLRGIFAGPNQVYCNGGTPVTICANGANHYIWKDSATGGRPSGLLGYIGADSACIVVAPSSTHGYIVYSTLAGSCRNSDTVTVSNAAIFSLHTKPIDSVVCKYVKDSIGTTPTPANLGPFHYRWSTNPTDTGSYVWVPVLGNTTYYVTATSAGGCAIHDSTKVITVGSAPRIFVSLSDDYICPGDSVTINTFAIAENLVSCGVVDTCPNNGISISVEAPSNDTSSTTGTTYTNIEGSPFRGNYSKYKVQYLFRASELNAVGLTSGSINGISFFVKTLNSTVPYDTFTVSMGCTNLDSLTDFVTGGLYETYPATPYTPNQGWSPLPFTHFFNWDGASNVIMQICYTIDPNSGFSNDDFVSYSNTPFSSTVYQLYGPTGQNGCAFSGGIYSNTAMTRPNVRFDMCTPDVLTYTWTPGFLGGCTTCTSGTVGPIWADSTYHVLVNDYNCHNDTNVVIHINRNLGFAATPHNAVLCNNANVQLNAALTNPPVASCLQDYLVTSIPYAPLTGTQTILRNNTFKNSGGSTDVNDGTSGPIALPFSFQFYCENYSEVYVNANGWISFVNPFPATSTFNTYTPEAFPITSTFNVDPIKIITDVWGDYILSANSNIGHFTVGSGSTATFVVQLNNLSSRTGGYSTNGQIQLHADGTIDVLTQSSNYAVSAHTTGISDTLNIGIAAPGRNDQPYTITTPEAWRFIPHSGSSVAITQTVWSPNQYLSNDSITNPIATPPSVQTYYVTSQLIINKFTHPSVCVVSDSVHLRVGTFHDTLRINPSSICPKDTAQLRINGTNPIQSVVWTPAASIVPSGATPDTAPRVTVDTTAMIYVTVTDIYGCALSDSILLSTYPVQHPNIGRDTTICYSDSVSLNVGGAYNGWIWYNTDATGNNHSNIVGRSATYNGHPKNYYIASVAGSGAGGCRYWTNVVLVDSFPRQHIAVTPAGATTFCDGQSVILNSTSGMSSYLWSTSANTSSITATTSGSYSYTARDLHSCLLYSDTVPVTVNPIPNIIIGNSKNPICSGETDTMTAVTTTPGTPTYTWTYQGNQTTGNIYHATQAGTYNVQVSVNGCVHDTFTTLVIAISPTVALHDTTYCDCAPNFVVLPAITSVVPITAYHWSDGSTTSTTNYGDYTNATPLHYTLTVVDQNNCTASSNQNTINIYCTKASIEVYPNDTLFKAAVDTNLLTALVNPASGIITSYVWSPDTFIRDQGHSATHLNLTQSGIWDTIYLVVTDTNQCTAKTMVRFFVTERDSFVVPNAFTPNGDNHNDVFFPVVSGGSGTTSKVTAFRIYNRWGQLIYDNPDPSKGWDGTYKGEPQPVDTYIYYVTVESLDSSDPTKKVTKSVQNSLQLFR
jgi:gliding motility-associated-like protein